ncbi:MAG: sterol desaturase family protein [Pseudomonadota bacterium]
MENAAAFLSQATLLTDVVDALVGAYGSLAAPFSRYYPPYLLAAFLIAVFAFFHIRRHLPEDKKDNLFLFLFNPKSLFSRSSLVDVKVTLANRCVLPVLALFERGALVASAYWFASLFASNAEFIAQQTSNLGGAGLVALTVMIVAVSDFTTYWVHRLHHESSLIWPFHRLHHSAETLTPITFTRKHPVYDLIRALSNAFLVGPAQGLIFGLFGVTDFTTILGVNAVTAIFFWSGANLRHSHVWLSYGPVLNRIFISPAQHQIHHSCAPEHHDKNYGEIFALWDWMFGTLYNPSHYEDLQFGVADREGRRIEQLHPTLKAAYLEPFSASYEALRKKDESARSAIAQN